MKTVPASINTIPLTLHIPQTLHEFREGARLLNSNLEFSEGLLFNFGKSQVLIMENSGVQCDINVLYFHKFTKYGIVEEIKTLTAQDSSPISSNSFYSICVELRKDFCELNNITIGSLLILKESIDV